jgi:hypothetical protein
VEFSLIAIYQISGEFIDIIDEYIPIFSFCKIRECDNPSENRILCLESCLFLYLTDHALFWTLPCLELATYAVPLSFMDIILLSYAMEHESLVFSVDVSEGGEFHVGIVSNF